MPSHVEATAAAMNAGCDTMTNAVDALNVTANLLQAVASGLVAQATSAPHAAHAARTPRTPPAPAPQS
eukprot:3204308-Prymnesium_polylepis.1